jgi:hypothetical protein
MKCLLGALAPLAISLCCAQALAQSALPPAYFQPRPAHVSISAPERATLQIVPKGGTGPQVECANYCDFWALPGRYTLYTRDHETGERHELTLKIKDNARFTFEQGNDTTRALGAGLGIAGALSGVAGFFMVLSNAAIAEDSGAPQTPAQRTRAELGLGLLLGSAVVTPIGWVMFGGSGPKLTELPDASAATNRAPRLRLGLVGVNGGLGLGGFAAF